MGIGIPTTFSGAIAGWMIGEWGYQCAPYGYGEFTAPGAGGVGCVYQMSGEGAGTPLGRADRPLALPRDDGGAMSWTPGWVEQEAQGEGSGFLLDAYRDGSGFGSGRDYGIRVGGSFSYPAGTTAGAGIGFYFDLAYDQLGSRAGDAMKFNPSYLWIYKHESEEVRQLWMMAIMLEGA